MRITHTFCATLLAAMLAGCGGGGSSSTSVPSTPANPQQPTVAAPAAYTVAPSSLTASAVEGYPAALDFKVKRAPASPEFAAVGVKPDSDLFEAGFYMRANADGGTDIQIRTSAAIKAGHYAGNLEVSLCLDANCSAQLPGSPFKLPYEVDVVPADGQVKPFSLTPLAALPGAEDWGTFQANASHTGYVPVILNPGAFSPRWKMDTPAIQGEQRVPSAVVTGGGRLFTAYGEGGNGGPVTIAAYNEADGSEAWAGNAKENLSARINAPAYANGKVYVVAGLPNTSSIIAIDSTNGSQVFNTVLGAGALNLAPTIYGDRVFTAGGSDDGNSGALYSIGASAGDRLAANMPNFEGWTPALDTHGLYAYVGGQLHVMDAATGATRAMIDDPKRDWNGPTGSGAPVIGSAGLVFAGNFGSPQKNAISAYDTVSNTVRWSSTGGYSGNPAYADGTVFVANNWTERLAALSELNGSVDWTWPRPDGESFVSDVLLTKNLVFVSTDRATYAIDRSSHQQVWRYRASGSLALSANGILYIKGKTSITAINLH